MIKPSDKLKDFPAQFNILEAQIKLLTENTNGIKIATWVNAISAATLAIIGVYSILKK